MLAEAEVKRRIISECEKLLDARGSSADLYRTADLLANDVLRILTSTYVDHPDFDPSWRGTACVVIDQSAGDPDATWSDI